MTKKDKQLLEKQKESFITVDDLISHLENNFNGDEFVGQVGYYGNFIPLYLYQFSKNNSYITVGGDWKIHNRKTEDIKVLNIEARDTGEEPL